MNTKKSTCVLTLFVVLVASSGRAAAQVYNGYENVTTGFIRLLPSNLPPPLNNSCDTTDKIALLRETPVSS